MTKTRRMENNHKNPDHTSELKFMHGKRQFMKTETKQKTTKTKSHS